jgi:hypothetical protein
MINYRGDVGGPIFERSRRVEHVEGEPTGEEKLKKRAGSVLGLETFYQMPEDLVLAKLRMIKATVPRERALKDEEDVKAILKFTKINVAAVRKQA